MNLRMALPMISGNVLLDVFLPLSNPARYSSTFFFHTQKNPHNTYHTKTLSMQMQGVTMREMERKLLDKDRL